MGRLQQMRAQTVGIRSEDTFDLPSLNHFREKSVTAAMQGEIKRRGLRRVAGNIFICQSQKDLWGIRNGKLMRLTGLEVDNGETVAAAPADNPGGFLRDALNDLTF